MGRCDFMEPVLFGGPSSRRTVAFVVEVMGFERPEYLRGKEVTHPRMENPRPAVHDAGVRVRL